MPAKNHIPNLTKDALKVAPQLLGAILTRVCDGVSVACRIVEVEAYGGPSDESSHAFGGKKMRNAPMFEEGGIFYVYFTYGNHHCLNVVTGRAGSGQAVLIRAAEPLYGTHQMARNRFGRSPESQNERYLLSNGPGKLCKALNITTAQNGLPVNSESLSITAGQRIKKSETVITTRIGISKSKDLPYRFYIGDNPWVSRK